MSKGQPGKRPYSSSLRSRQQEATRRLILEAVAGLVAEGRIHVFSVQDVADRAGISYASVYRHFPTREALLEAIYEWSAELAGAQMPPAPRMLDEIPAWIEASIPVFEQHPDVVQAMMVILAALNITPASQRRRDKTIEELVAEGAPHLRPQMVRQAAAVIRYLAGAQGWAALRRRFGLDAADTSAALTWAIRALIRDLKQHGASAGPAQYPLEEST